MVAVDCIEQKYNEEQHAGTVENQINSYKSIQMTSLKIYTVMMLYVAQATQTLFTGL